MGLTIHQDRITPELGEKLSKLCPFGAIDFKEGKPELNAACRVCGLCVKNCPEQALIRLETRETTVDKSKWKGILVFAEVSGGRLHPVGLELIGKALDLPRGTVVSLLYRGREQLRKELKEYGI